MSDFDLRALVKSVCDTSSLTNDDDLTKEVLAQIDEADEHDALQQALLVYVRRFVSRDHRPLAFPSDSPGDQAGGDAQKYPVAGGPIPFRSRKVSSIRSGWQSQLQARYNVGHKTRKFFGDCTLDDLAFIAKHRREFAAANLRTADYVDSIAELMRQAGAETVRELPEDVINTLGGAA